MYQRLGGRLAAAVGLALVAAPPTSAQSKPPQEPPVFGSELKVVAVPVFVTDKSGRAVGGLTAADFELEDQGRKVPLSAFLAIDTAAPEPAGADAGPLVQATARRQFLLLFDLTFSTPTGIMRARDAAIGLVRGSLAPSDLASVATFSQRGISILVGFTPDRDQLERAITTLGLAETQPPARDVLSIAYDMGVQRWGQGIGPTPGDESRHGQMQQYLIDMSRLMARGDQAYYKQRVDGFLDGLQQLVATLDAVQGRKQVVLLSAGFDSSVIAGARGQESQEASEAVLSGRLWEVQTDRYFGDARARDALDAVFKAIASTDTVLHTVDVTGMGAGGGVADALPQPVGRGRDTLAQLALNTGGRFVSDANDLRAGLESLLDASRRYYVLAFEPLDPKGKPDKLRKLKVRVRGEGLQVSHRRGYTIAGPRRDGAPATAALQAAEAIAKGLSGGELTLHAVAVPYRNGRGRASLPVILEIEGQSLAASAEKQLGLDVFGYAFDGEGRIRDVMTLAPALDLAAVRPSLEASGLQLITSFDVPEGPVDLRFVVREKASSRSGSLRLPVSMPAFGDGSPVVSPPLATSDPRARLVLPAPSRLLPQLEIPFRLGAEPFTADPLPTLVSGAPRELCVMAWTGGAATDGEEPVDGDPDDVDADDVDAPDIEALLVDGDGRTYPLPFAREPRAVADADGTTRYVVAVAPKGVPPGRYKLRLVLTDADLGEAVQSEIGVLVREP